MSYTPEQKQVIGAIKAIGRRRGVPRKYIKAALEIGKVESNFRNLSYGDADSQGWRQERASIYKNPTNLHASINRVYDEMRQHDRGQRAGLLAADVQRPAAQYRGRYTQVSGEARALLGGGSLKAPAKLGGSLGGTTSYRLPGTPDRTTTDRSAAVVDALLHHRGGSLLKAVTANLDSGEFTRTVPGTPGKTVTMGGETPGLESPAGGGKGSGYLGRVIKRANRIDSKHLPYQWGGGHSPDAKHKTVPLDCSGAVSKVLGIDPRVASQFKTWGKPGRGGKITVYAKDDHVLVEINGHFWGTSAANPGGGAGWIPRSHITPAYISGFTARHL
jgi:hypothetical protein